jgi:hypothetical protein
MATKDKPVNVVFDQDTYTWLTKRADEDGVSRSAIVRQAVNLMRSAESSTSIETAGQRTSPVDESIETAGQGVHDDVAEPQPKHVDSLAAMAAELRDRDPESLTAAELGLRIEDARRRRNDPVAYKATPVAEQRERLEELDREVRRLEGQRDLRELDAMFEDRPIPEPTSPATRRKRRIDPYESTEKTEHPAEPTAEELKRLKSACGYRSITEDWEIDPASARPALHDALSLLIQRTKDADERKELETLRRQHIGDPARRPELPTGEALSVLGQFGLAKAEVLLDRRDEGLLHWLSVRPDELSWRAADRLWGTRYAPRVLSRR